MPNTKDIHKPQQVFVKFFEGRPQTIEVYINAWLNDEGRKIHIECQNMTSILSGNEVRIYVMLRYLWINR